MNLAKLTEFAMDLLHLDANPFLSGGLILMMIGGVLFYLKQLPGRIYNLIERFFIVKIEILDEDESYQWMQVWLAEKLRSALSISVVTRRKRAVDPDYAEGVVDESAGKPTVYFVPAVGTYFFWYRGRFVSMNRDRRENTAGTPVLPGGGDGRTLLREKESFTLRIFSRDKELARQLIEECRDKAIPCDDKLDIRVATHNYWSLGTRIKPRRLQSVILDGSQASELLADMQEFLISYPWYQETGVPFRRGYLLHGPPGNGKTSVVKALAGELRMSIYLLMLSDPDMNDNRINDLLARAGPMSNSTSATPRPSRPADSSNASFPIRLALPRSLPSTSRMADTAWPPCKIFSCCTGRTRWKPCAVRRRSASCRLRPLPPSLSA